MKVNTTIKAALIAAGLTALGATPALATAIQVPEPSTLSIFGAAAAALVIGARWMRRK